MAANHLKVTREALRGIMELQSINMCDLNEQVSFMRGILQNSNTYNVTKYSLTKFVHITIFCIKF